MIAESGSLWHAQCIFRLALLLGLRVALAVSNACEQCVVLEVSYGDGTGNDHKTVPCCAVVLSCSLVGRGAPSLDDDTPSQTCSDAE
jgi:hypothetical protein